MAVSTPGACVLTIICACILGVTTASNNTPMCEPWPTCEGNGCPVELTELDEEECKCKLMFEKELLSPRPLRLKCWDDTSVVIKIPKTFEPGNDSVLVVPGRDGQNYCYNVKTAKSKVDRKNFRKGIRLRCSHKDLMSLEDISVLNGNTLYDKTSFSGKGTNSTCKIVTPTSIKKSCACWSPSGIVIIPNGNSNLTVQWYPFYGCNDLRVRIEDVNSPDINKDKTLPIYQLCRHHLRNFTFSDFKPGTYKAMVGAQGSECMQITKSEAYFLRVPVLPPPITTTWSPETSPTPPITAAVVTVGVLAFVATVAFGLILVYVRRRRNRDTYEAVPPKMTDMDTLLLETQSEHSTEMANALRFFINRPDIVMIPKERPGDIIMANSLLIRTSQQDCRTYQTPDTPVPLATNIVTVLVDYWELDEHLQSPLVVHVPAGIDHPTFAEMPNETRGQNQILELCKVLKYINPECDFTRQEYKDLVTGTKEMMKRETDTIQNAFIISGFMHEHHNKSCLELAKLVKAIDKNTAYIAEEANREDLRGFGPVSWTLEQLEKADLVVVVVSEFLYKLADRYNGERDIPYQYICAPLALKELSLMPKHKLPKIMYVSFGYESAYIDKIVAFSPLLQSDMRYDLIDHKQTAVFGDDRGHTDALEIFLSRLCSDRRLVQAAYEMRGEFIDNVQAMKAVMREPRWLERTCRSIESLESLMTTSKYSLSSHEV